MDSRSTTSSQSRGVSGPPQPRSRSAYGPWPFVLGVLIFMKLIWCAKLYYSLWRGDLDGTPAQRLHTSFLTTFGVVWLEMLSYPGMHVLSHARNFTWPSNAPLYFIQAFLWSMNGSVICIMAFITLHRLPPTIPPDTPGYDLSALREYRAFRSVDLPVFATLSMFCAVAIVVDCAMWMHWEFERQRRARSDTELRGLRMRTMFGRREGHEDMVTGVLRDGEGGGPKEGEAV